MQNILKPPNSFSTTIYLCPTDIIHSLTRTLNTLKHAAEYLPPITNYLMNFMYSPFFPHLHTTHITYYAYKSHINNFTDEPGLISLNLYFYHA